MNGLKCNMNEVESSQMKEERIDSHSIDPHSIDPHLTDSPQLKDKSVHTNNIISQSNEVTDSYTTQQDQNHYTLTQSQLASLELIFNDLNSNKTLFTSNNDICTPIECVYEMIDKIVELNPNLIQNDFEPSILDPCCGYGNFEVGLLKYFPNTNKYYLNDINTDRTDLLSKLFKNIDISFPNISNIDYINNSSDSNFDLLSRYNLTGFDLIVCNPPYASMKDNKRSAKNHNLFSKFILKSFEQLNPNGVMCFIVPNSWMSLSNSNSIPFLLTSHHLQYLCLDSKKYFKSVGSSFTWFVCKKIVNTQSLPLILEDNDHVEQIEQIPINFIPIVYNRIVLSIISKTLLKDNDKFDIQTDSYLHRFTKREHLSTKESDVFRYTVIHTLNQKLYSDIPHRNQDKYKVFISLTSYYKTCISRYGNTQGIAYLICKDEDEANRMKLILDHKLYVFLNNICRWSNFNYISILKLFPYYDGDVDKIYSHFGLSDEEVKYIEDL